MSGTERDNPVLVERLSVPRPEGAENMSHRTSGGTTDSRATRMIYVPFNAAGVPNGRAGMPRAIHSAGIEERLPGIVRSTWIPIDTVVPARGPAALLAEEALTSMVTNTAAALSDAWRDGEVPLVVAGDCPVLLAALIAAKARGGGGLVFIDGHEDAWDPRASLTGEAADCEIGLALGIFHGPNGLGELPCLRPEHLAILGPRDQDEIAAAGQAGLRDRVAGYLSGAQLAARPESHTYTEAADLVAETAANAAAGWWFHIDLDVLATASLSAVDYRQPGGLTWKQLERLSAACSSVPGCLGASIVIYNPDLDGGRAAERIADFIAFIRDRLGSARKD
ncbi:arginase family protein [Nocardia wallacei]|uniref:arginase family protein n=2 Tax=Nocardia wallacei TaxID=480035 RepID=UPI0024569359|nr:arginase family protein [Nocardia wallacei]